MHMAALKVSCMPVVAITVVTRTQLNHQFDKKV